MASLEDAGQKTTCEWTPDAVSCLLEAYGEKHALGRTYLKIKDWEDVVNRVNAHCDTQRCPKTMKQCRDKVDSLKKRYKLEKRKAIVAGLTHSSWPFFAKLDEIMTLTPKLARADAIAAFQHQIIRIPGGAIDVKQRLSSLDSSYEKLEEHRSDSFDEKSDELGSPHQSFTADSSSQEDADSIGPEHSETETSPRKGRTVLEDDGFSEGALNSPDFLKKRSLNDRLGSQESLDNGSCQKKVEPLSKAHDSLTAKKKIGKKTDPVQSLADAIIGFSQVYARIELAKMELYTSMNLEIAKLRMKNRKSKKKSASARPQDKRADVSPQSSCDRKPKIVV